MTPAMQALRRQLAREYASGVIPEAFRNRFRALSKYTNILSFNWRTIALFASLFAGMPWLYFAFELIVLNTLLIYMVLHHEKICRTLTQELRDGKYPA